MNLKKCLKRMGYDLVDQVDIDRKQLAKKARSKLTDEEYAALMNIKSDRIEQEI